MHVLAKCHPELMRVLQLLLHERAHAQQVGQRESGFYGVGRRGREGVIIK